MADLGHLGHIPGIEDRRFDRVKLIRQEHAGCFPALNRGIREMTTEWFAWLSSDDLFYPPKIERQIAAMKSAKELASYHSYDVMVGEGHVHETIFCPYGWRTIDEQRGHLSQGCSINGLTAMIHRSVLDDLRLTNGNVFDTSYTIAADWDLWNRVALTHLWIGMTDILATRRDYRDEIMNASQRYARDPEKVRIWKEEDDRIRATYAPKEIT